MSRSAEVTLPFGGEDRVFRLALGRLRALQERCDAGPQTLLQRLMDGSWRVDDVRETILQGLIGGGMAQVEATTLLTRYFDDLPITQFVSTATGVLLAALVGAGDENDLGEHQGEDHHLSPSPEESSASPASMAPAPSSASPREKSTT